VRVVELMPIGYPAEDPDPRARMSMDEFVVMESWT